MKNFRYKKILLFSSLQFAGNHVEYFLENTEKLVVYYVMPRGGKEQNMVQLYKKGALIKEQVFYSPANFILCYALLYLNYIRILFFYFSYKEKFYIFSGHPLFSFFKSLIGLFRRFEFVYFIGDYYPGGNILYALYRFVSHYYHDHAKYKVYLSDRLNKKYNNGKIINTENTKTIMWGVQIPPDKKNISIKNIQLCFIGAVRQSHGLEETLVILKKKKDLKIKVLGTCNQELYTKYTKLIKRWQIADRVYFPNRFVPKLETETYDCHIGVALYTINAGTYFADPGKVKAYAQLGLPILMTDAAEISGYIKKYNAGEIVKGDPDSILEAVGKIQENYCVYIAGLKKFNNYFNYKTYYPPRFAFLEKDIL